MPSKLFFFFLLCNICATPTLVLATQEPCRSPKHFYEFSVLARDGIEVAHSDFEGSVGSEGDIFSENFSFEEGANKCISIVTPGNFYLISGAISHYVVADNIQISNAGQRGISSNDFKIILPAIYGELLAYSQDLSLRSANTFFDSNASTIKIGAFQAENIVQLDSETLKQKKNIFILANPNAKIIFNISGMDAELIHTNVVLGPNVKAEQIEWNFFEAKKLFISHTANGSYGIPGKVLAPLAECEFYEGLIVGGLYVKSIIRNIANSQIPTGQINKPGHYN